MSVESDIATLGLIAEVTDEELMGDLTEPQRMILKRMGQTVQGKMQLQIWIERARKARMEKR